MYFVAGITSPVGGAVASHLHARGKKMCTIEHDPMDADFWGRSGVRLGRGDLCNPVDVAGGLHDAEAAFLWLPPILSVSQDDPELWTIVASYQAALRRTSPRRVVFVSSFGAKAPGHLGLLAATHLLREALGDLPCPCAFVRPGWLLESYLPAFAQGQVTGAFDSLLAPTGRAVPMVATDDVGALIAQLLAEGWAGNQTVEIGTPISPDDLACVMAEVLGQEVRVRGLAQAHWSSALKGVGWSADSAGWYEEMLAGINAGRIDFGTPGAESVAGTSLPAQIFKSAHRSGP